MLNYSPEAEQGVLGSCLLSGKAYDVCATKLTEDDFAVVNHRLIYRAISELREKGKGVDIVTVNANLQAVDTAKESSFDSSEASLQYLAALEDVTPSAVHAEHYADVVKEHALSRQLKAAANEINRIADEPGEDRASKAAAVIEEVAADKKGQSEQSARQVMFSTLTVLEERMKQSGTVSGLATGFKHLDEITAGLQKSDLFILAGRPSQGKTAVAMTIVSYVARKTPVIVFSLEMSKQALGERLISSVGRIEFNRVRAGIFTEGDRIALDAVVPEIAGMKMVVDDTAGLSVDQLRTRARVYARKYGCGLIVVDYLQLLTGKGENKTTEIGYISRKLKELAKDLDVPVIALSQLNRGLSNRANKRPEMSELRGSGDIEQDADVIAFIHLEQKYDKDTHLYGLGELIIAKQRQGETGVIFLKEDLKHMRYLTNNDPVPPPPAGGKKSYPKVTAFNAAGDR